MDRKVNPGPQRNHCKRFLLPKETCGTFSCWRKTRLEPEVAVSHGSWGDRAKPEASLAAPSGGTHWEKDLSENHRMFSFTCFSAFFITKDKKENNEPWTHWTSALKKGPWEAVPVYLGCAEATPVKHYWCNKLNELQKFPVYHPNLSYKWTKTSLFLWPKAEFLERQIHSLMSNTEQQIVKNMKM